MYQSFFEKRRSRLRFNAIEITVMFHTHPSTSSSERKKVCRWLDDAGIVCSGIHFIFDDNVKLASTYKENIQHSILYNRAVIDLAADLNTKTIVVGGGKIRSVKPEQSREEIMKILFEIFAASGDYAKERGVYLGIEAMNLPAAELRGIYHSLKQTN
ncbi:MAG: TIM barrel protein [Candidatus Atribacteria bacterium]|nr:TIM barrel protein [Candidatus Atribacteria bacterium]